MQLSCLCMLIVVTFGIPAARDSRGGRAEALALFLALLRHPESLFPPPYSYHPQGVQEHKPQYPCC